MDAPSRPSAAGRPGSGALPLWVGLPAVALAVAPGFVEPFTSPKWYALTILAAGWLLWGRFRGGASGLPSFVRRTWLGWLLFTAWVVGSALRHGAAWATAPLLAWTGFGALALASYWSARSRGPGLDGLRGSVAIAAALVLAVGLPQAAGLRSPAWPSGGDGRSSTFGNVNMAAQFAGLTLVVLFSRSWRGGTLARRLPAELLGLAGSAFLVLAGTRSVALASLAAFAVAALVRRSRESAGRAGLAAVVAALVFVPPSLHGLDGAAAAKAASARWRLAVWSDTLDLVREHPLGVGAGNFEVAFAPYAVAGRAQPGEALVFRSPHNDYLRLAAEEGLPAAALLLVLLALLARRLSHSASMGGWASELGTLIAAGGAFVAVEAFFQFPFELAFPSLLSAVVLGLALAAVEPEAAAAPERTHAFASRAGDVGVVLVACGLLAGTARLAWADRLFATRRADPASLGEACRLDPRRLDACVEAAWHASRAGRHTEAQARLDAVLARAPAYPPALKLRAEDLVAGGRREAGCRYAREYDALFGGSSSLHPIVAGCGPP